MHFGTGTLRALSLALLAGAIVLLSQTAAVAELEYISSGKTKSGLSYDTYWNMDGDEVLGVVHYVYDENGKMLGVVIKYLDSNPNPEGDTPAGVDREGAKQMIIDMADDLDVRVVIIPAPGYYQILDKLADPKDNPYDEDHGPDSRPKDIDTDYGTYEQYGPNKKNPLEGYDGNGSVLDWIKSHDNEFDPNLEDVDWDRGSQYFEFGEDDQKLEDLMKILFGNWHWLHLGPPEAVNPPDTDKMLLEFADWSLKLLAAEQEH